MGHSNTCSALTSGTGFSTGQAREESRALCENKAADDLSQAMQCALITMADASGVVHVVQCVWCTWCICCISQCARGSFVVAGLGRVICVGPAYSCVRQGGAPCLLFPLFLAFACQQTVLSAWSSGLSGVTCSRVSLHAAAWRSVAAVAGTGLPPAVGVARWLTGCSALGAPCVSAALCCDKRLT